LPTADVGPAMHEKVENAVGDRVVGVSYGCIASLCVVLCDVVSSLLVSDFGKAVKGHRVLGIRGQGSFVVALGARQIGVRLGDNGSVMAKDANPSSMIFFDGGRDRLV